MKFYIDTVKEIFCPAVNDDFYTVWSQQVQLIHHSVFFPIIGIFTLFSKYFAHFPVIRKRTNIYSSAHASASPEHILMTEA